MLNKPDMLRGLQNYILRAGIFARAGLSFIGA
jgi:hypothetical protein